MLLLWASIGRPPALPVLPPNDTLLRQQIAEDDEILMILSLFAAQSQGQSVDKTD